jgi:hypothetical protein
MTLTMPLGTYASAIVAAGASQRDRSAARLVPVDETVDKLPVMPFARREGGGSPAPAAPQACRIASQSAGRTELAGRGIGS